jgi:phospholipid transport system substrate-binding protein
MGNKTRIARLYGVATTLILALALCLPTIDARAAEPLAEVQSTVDKVLTLLRNKELPQAERRQQLTAVIRPAFDFEVMSQWVLGPNWRQASATERQRFIELFSDLLEATYIGKIEGYTDERVEYAGQKIEGEKAEVETFVKTRSADIPLRYKLFRKAGRWLVYDVVIEEVSLVRNYRSTYDEIVRKEGFSGLFARMEDKIRELKAPKAAS